jgi:hypothetical protein
MTKTQIANIALSHLGEPAATDIDVDTTTAATVARTHYDNTLRTLLETHPWNFARALTRLIPSEVTVTYTKASGTFSSGLTTHTVALSLTTYTDAATTYTGTDADDNVFTLTKAAATAYAELSAVDDEDAPLTDYDATTDTLPEGAFPYQEDWTTIDAAMSEVTTQLSTAFAPWTVAYDLPAACLRVLRFATTSDTALQRFEIVDRKLLADTEDTLNLYYTTSAPPLASYPPSFINAFTLLLASDMARQITGSEQTASDFLQKHKLALNQALTKDTRETQSGENMTPRRLAMKSGLYRSRFRNNGGPGFDL